MSEVQDTAAALAAEALAENRSLLLIAPGDDLLPDISNALALDLRPLCLVLPEAEYVRRIVLRATLSLLKSRLTRFGEDTEGPAWAAQRNRIAEHAELWRACLAWSERGLDREPWPSGIERFFPVRILPLALARALSLPSDSVVILGVGEETAPTVALAVADETVRLRAELEMLAQELSELELELATAQAEIADFTRRYHALVGMRMARLDGLQAEIADRRAAETGEAEARHAAETARARAERSRRESERFAEVERDPARPFRPTGDLKKLYRQLAQKIHPDRARDEADRAWRTQLMSEANRAYRAGDEVALQEVVALWQEGREGAGRQRRDDASPADIATQVARLKRRIGEIEGELNRLFGSRLYELFTAANMARRAGRDLLQEMADKLDAQIAAAQGKI
ncbi:MAG: J domain-containing protein [Candidatus Nitricoxidivorans perseverans]|uniref:J domain-containing protein n=1 Tax=Candidatus Nitricoxidivorans perseverans TaxID=2975601 RepID=A0AA49FN86_9PROT|nr:MAG: J domain-containing protein [Candidatus Nitricoxidivorans perseverans]